jgi:hypothetical protein
LIVASVVVSADVLGQPTSPAVLATRAAKEAFLSTASIPGASTTPPSATYGRITLVDGTTKHLATIQAANGSDAVLNVAAYELDKILDINFVAPAVVRTVNGQPAVVVWWLDGVVMDELSRRKSKTEPPDLGAWNKQLHVVRVFDELVANAYRDVNPDLYLSTVWDNLLITKDWTIWLIDHTRTFQTRPSLDHPESLAQCDRSLLQKLRGLNPDVLKQRLAKYLAREQIEALESRRQLLVRHFDRQIASRGERAVLYDLPPRP